MWCDGTYLFDEIACFLSLLFKIFYLVHVDLVEKGCCVRTCLAQLLLVAQVGFAVNWLFAFEGVVAGAY